MTTERKRGKLSTEEMQFLKDNLNSLSDQELAQRLNRNPELIARYRITIPARQEVLGEFKAEDIATELKTKPFWPSIEEQFNQQEIVKFKRLWIDLVGQFKQQGIQPTDEQMIKDYISMELILDQTLAQRRQLKDRMDATAQQIQAEMQKGDVRDPALISVLHTDLNADRSTILALGREIKELQKLKDDKFKDLKATREQRFKQIEESSKNIGELIKVLHERQNRVAEGRRNALCQLCVEKERQRFGQLHQFADGVMRRPLLNADTINYEYGEEDEEYSEGETATSN